MNKTFIVNFVGKASASTIKEFAAVTHENGGKWLISKVNFIDDRVAAVIKIDIPKENEAAVKRVISENPDLIAQFVDVDTHSHDKNTLYLLRLDADDRAGIVNDITHILESQNVEIVDIDCQRVFIANGSGVASSLFTSSMALHLPETVEITDIAKELEALSEDTRVIIKSEE